MHIFSLRRIFRALHGVKYSTCEQCGEPISASSNLHSCNPQQIPLNFYYTKLTESSRSVHFYDRSIGRGFLHEVKVWASGYILGVELTIEDLKTKQFYQIRRGETVGKFFRLSLTNGEFIQKVEFGCDFHGMYYLGFVSNKQEMGVGDMNRPIRMFEFPKDCGLVGLFGGFTDKILHLGFYFDSIFEVNWARHRELMLIKSKGRETEGNQLNLLLRLDDQLFRYLASFV